MNRKEIAEMIGNEEALFLDEKEYDKAIIGNIENSFGNNVIVYDTEKVIKILVDDFKISLEDAVEYFDYNINFNNGENDPIYINLFKGGVE